jgi:hypothetical protein
MGFRFGKPERPNELSLACILPILRETSQERQYITLPETENVLVSDSGTINKVNLKNASKKNVYVRSGTIFEGKGTQSRALTRSAVLFPGTEVALDVRCVHQTHGIRTGAEFKYGGITPLSVDSAVYSAGYRQQDQQSTWNAVRQTSAAMRTMSGFPEQRAEAPLAAEPLARFRGVPPPLPRPVSPSVAPAVTMPPAGDVARGFYQGEDNLKQNFDEFARNFDTILSKARLHENQVGLALIMGAGDVIKPAAPNLVMLGPALSYFAVWYLLGVIGFYVFGFEPKGRTFDEIDSRHDAPAPAVATGVRASAE